MTETRKTRKPGTAAPRLPGPTPEPSPAADTAWVTLARLVRPRGLRGELLADILTDFPERFSERRRLFLRAALPPDKRQQDKPQEVELQEHWLHQGRLVLKFLGIDSMTAAETLRGHEVVIPREQRAPLEDGAVYIGDLTGCVLHDRSTGVDVGEIVDVDRQSSNMELLVVRTPAGAEILIPFAKAYEPRIDLEGRRMEMTLPEGLLALDAPEPEVQRPAGAPSGSRRRKRS